MGLLRKAGELAGSAADVAGGAREKLTGSALDLLTGAYMTGHGGVREFQAGYSGSEQPGIDDVASVAGQLTGSLAGLLSTRRPPRKPTAATDAPPAAGNPTAMAGPASGASRLPGRDTPEGKGRMENIRAANEAGPRVMMSDDPEAVLGLMGGRGSEVDPSVNIDVNAKSPFVGLSAADRERLQGALGDINDRYFSNMADIEAREALQDPRRREIQEAAIEHALAMAEQQPMEDELAGREKQTALERAQPYVEGFEAPLTAGEEVAMRPAEKMRTEISEIMSQLPELRRRFNLDPGDTEAIGPDEFMQLLGSFAAEIQAILGGQMGQFAAPPAGLAATLGQYGAPQVDPNTVG